MKHCVAVKQFVGGVPPLEETAEPEGLIAQRIRADYAPRILKERRLPTACQAKLGAAKNK